MVLKEKPKGGRTIGLGGSGNKGDEDGEGDCSCEAEERWSVHFCYGSG